MDRYRWMGREIERSRGMERYTETNRDKERQVNYKFNKL